MSGARERMPLLAALRDPAFLRSVPATRWERLLEEADRFRLAARIADDAITAGVDGEPWLRDRLDGLRLAGDASDRAVRWEYSRILEVLHPLGITVLALKGLAYVLLDLPFARGRRIADVDILVPEAVLGQVEATLLARGWIARQLDPYDERYYRLWTHELPPMAHARRQVPLDLHHGLVPRTSRLKPDVRRILANSVACAPDGEGRVPSPPHLVVHAAIHLFHDGEIAGSLRDLVDLDGLFRHFGGNPGFWDELVAEASALGAGRPLFYAVRYTQDILDTPVPKSVTEAIRRWAPSSPALNVMDRLVPDALVRRVVSDRSIPAMLLRGRAHWLRMPPLLLARHLAQKTLHRRRRPPAA